MRRKDWMLTFSIFILAITILLVIVYANMSKLPNSQNNGFSRIFLPKAILPQKEIKFNLAKGNICGTTDESIYISTDNAKLFYRLDMNFNKIDTFYLNLPVSAEVARGGLLLIDSPWIYFHANNLSKIYTANWNNPKIDSIGLSTTIFTKSIQLSPEKVVVRAFDSSYQEQIFQLADCRNGKAIDQRKIIEHQDMMGFSSDGFFTFNRSTHQIMYVQYYTNRFYAIDSNLNVLFEGKTIDTVTQNIMALNKIKHGEEERVAPESARTTVNISGFLTKKYLFIRSGLKADNESRSEFSQNSIVDIYQSMDGKYVGSFYIPNHKGQKTNSITIVDDTLFALYKNGMVSYKLNLKKYSKEWTVNR